MLDLLCSFHRRHIHTVFQTIRKLFSRLSDEEGYHRVLLVLTQFFINHGQRHQHTHTHTHNTHTHTHTHTHTQTYTHTLSTGQSEMYSYEPAVNLFFNNILSNKFSEYVLYLVSFQSLSSSVILTVSSLFISVFHCLI